MPITTGIRLVMQQKSVEVACLLSCMPVCGESSGGFMECRIIDPFDNFLSDNVNFQQIYKAFSHTLCIFAIHILKGMPKGQVIRLKIVLAEKQRFNKWLVEQLGKDLARHPSG